MKSTRKVLLALGFLGAALSVAGCSSGIIGPGGPSPGPSSNPGTVSTVNFVAQGDGSLLFSTNDTAFKGQTFIYHSTGVTNGSYTYTVATSKASGKAAGGFGLVFQRQDPSDFWLVDIDTQGYYTLAKVVNGVFYYSTQSGNSTWESCPGLRSGYGVTNTLALTYDGTTFHFSVNGTPVVSFTDQGQGTAYPGGNLGVDVGVLSDEDFPDTPVSVSFSINGPSGLVW